MSIQGEDQVQPSWRERLKQIGKQAFIREEMERLGFWPPSEGVSEKAAEAEAKLKVLYVELSKARMELKEVQEHLASAHDVTQMIAEIRKRRIERVRAERETRRQQRMQGREEHRRQTKEWRQKTMPFLGHGVSGGLRYEGGDPARIGGLGLPAMASASEIALSIGIGEQGLVWLTYHRGAALIDHYHRFTIPKRNGGTRVISSPKRQLRVAQRWLLEKILSHISIHDAAMAFRPQRSVLHNAALHTGKALVVRIDLKDFFPSIGFRRVKGLFESFGYNEGVSSILALLATEAPRVSAALDGQRRYVAVGDRQLPQGACTSPAITNILCRRMDARLAGASHAFGFTYSRYADDLVFSHPSSNAPAGPFLALVREIVSSEGYTINEKKTAAMRPQHRQVVTGLVVNEAPSISREDLRRFRAFLHHCEQHGLEEMSRRMGKNAEAYAKGYLSFIHMVNPTQEARFRQAHPWLSD